MKKISQWASLHRNSAIILVVLIKILLAVMAVYLGLLLSQAGVHLSALIVYLSIPVVFLTAVYYPLKGNGWISKDRLYIRRKTSDFILSLCSFLSICTCINNLDAIGSPVPRSLGSITLKKTNPPSAQEILSSLSSPDKKSLTRQEKRILKKEFNKQVKVYVKAKLTGNKDESGKAFLIILTIIGALGLLALLASLVCSLSCAGSDAAAILVALLGLAGIIWATVAVIKAIKRGPKKKKDEAPSQ